MKRKRCKLYAGILLLLLFVLWTAALCCIDVQPIGPNGSSVGFATLNKTVFSLLGNNMLLYTVTDWLGAVPICTALGFAAAGFVQLLRRNGLRHVDRYFLRLSIFYIVVIGVYLLFEAFPINYRPILIEGTLEASYPSSTTLLCLCLMSAAAIQLHRQIRHTVLRRIAVCTVALFTVCMIVGRTLSGVHWISDIIGAILAGAGLTMLYAFGEEQIP